MNLDEISRLQKAIMEFVSQWVKLEKTPVPQKEIISFMKTEGIKDFTTANAITMLVKRGYIRRAHSFDGRTSYVQIRSIG